MRVGERVAVVPPVLTKTLPEQVVDRQPDGTAPFELPPFKR